MMLYIVGYEKTSGKIKMEGQFISEGLLILSGHNLV